MPNFTHDRILAARAGTNPTVICRMPSGWAVLADAQFLRGYCILLSDTLLSDSLKSDFGPSASAAADGISPDLNALDEAGRARFLLDMAILGDALLEVTRAYRINYEILGNTDPVLHAHIFPRYLSEPEDLRKGPAWLYDREFRLSVPFDPARDRPLMAQIAAAVHKRLA